MQPCVKASRHLPQSFHLRGGQGRRAPASRVQDAGIHGGLLEPLLAAAVTEDELVCQLLRAHSHGERGRVAELARRIAGERDQVNRSGRSKVKSPHTEPVIYQNKLLSAIHREEILLDSIAAASARGERSALSRLCRELTANRKRFDPEFRRVTTPPKEPDL